MGNDKSKSDQSVEGSQKAYETFRNLLCDFAPLPWEVIGGFIVDANGKAILGSMMTDPDTIHRVLGAVICGVATCGGYEIECVE
jgi:hypothetical protein